MIKIDEGLRLGALQVKGPPPALTSLALRLIGVESDEGEDGEELGTAPEAGAAPRQDQDKEEAPPTKSQVGRLMPRLEAGPDASLEARAEEKEKARGGRA